ncbi:MAG: hypothetical protein HDT43_04870 [Ruminococcaceae bacterium]|nr:hypothetical protein [Oscillospiraceae bacterium]
MNIKSKVMTIANALVKQGISRSAAMVRAWITVKLRRMEVKAVGVTRGNRQTLLERLMRYSADDITVTLRREQGNTHDSNAIQIVAAVRNKGAAVIGYINRELAAALAPLLDKGAVIASSFKAITGGGAPYMNYGFNLELKV